MIKVGRLSPRKSELYSSTLIRQTQSPELWRCLVCQSMFKQNSISEENAAKLYAESSSIERWSAEMRGSQTFLDKKTATVAKVLLNAMNQAQSILDVGCNDGLFLDCARDHGLITAGVEYSWEGREVCCSNGHKIYGALEEVNAKYDLITAFDVVEHLYDITGFFNRCRNILVRHGCIIILTGDPDCLMARIARQNWWYASFPEHVLFPGSHYLASVDGFALVKRLCVTHSRPGPRFPLRFARALISNCRKGLLGGLFNSLSGVLPDHQLVVLRALD